MYIKMGKKQTLKLYNIFNFFVAKTNKGVSTGRHFLIPGDQTICSYFHVVFVADGVLADPVMRQEGKSEAMSVHRDWRTLLTLWFLALWCHENSVLRTRNQSWVLPAVKKWVGRSLGAKEVVIQTGHQNLLGQCQTTDIDMEAKLLKYRFKPTVIMF